MLTSAKKFILLSESSSQTSRTTTNLVKMMFFYCHGVLSSNNNDNDNKNKNNKSTSNKEWGGRSLMSVRDCDQRGKSNLSIHNVKSDEKCLKATSKKLQLKAKLERKK